MVVYVWSPTVAAVALAFCFPKKKVCQIKSAATRMAMMMPMAQ